MNSSTVTRSPEPERAHLGGRQAKRKDRPCPSVICDSDRLRTNAIGSPGRGSRAGSGQRNLYLARSPLVGMLVNGDPDVRAELGDRVEQLVGGHARDLSGVEGR